MRYSNTPLGELIPYLLSLGKEGEFWDFKQEWHKNIEDLIKDIICFANTVHDEDCYLIFGISDDCILTGMQTIRRQQADILDAIDKLHFAGDVAPKIYLETVVLENIEIDVLRIYNCEQTPVFLKKPYGQMLQGCIYARVGDKNTANKSNADISTIENLWKKRFGLTKPPREYILDKLSDKTEWVRSENAFYNIYKPEYKLRFHDEEEFNRLSDEFYGYAQTNESMSFAMLDVMVHETVVDSYQIVILDSGRLSIPIPEWGFIPRDKWHQNSYAYKYYVYDSDGSKLLQFMYDGQNSDARWALQNHLDVVLLFHSEEEKNCFESYARVHLSEIENRVEASSEYDYIMTDSETKTQAYKERLRLGNVLRKMLSEMRSELNIDDNLTFINLNAPKYEEYVNEEKW